MNDYGYLVYDSSIEIAEALIRVHTLAGVFDNQTNAEEIIIQHGLTPEGYQNWASFEQGEFDFEKPIYTNENENLIPFSTVAVSNGNGWFTDSQGNDIAFLFTVFPNEPYSGDGFTLQTYYEEYEVYAKVVDGDGIRYENFKKTKDMEEEFFPLPYNELDQLQLYFKFPPNHFAKFISFGFGGTRLIMDENLAEEPQIDNYYSLMSDELPLDTLSFRVYGNINFVAGNKITVSTGEEFYVDTVELNSDNTVTVNCYDGLVKRDVAFGGMMRTNTNVKDSSTLSVLFGDLEYRFDPSTRTFGLLTWGGTVSDDVTYREAIRMLLQGCTFSLKRVNRFYMITSAYNDTSTPKEFNKSNIVSIDYEALEKYTRVHFSKHRFTINKANGLQEAFRGVVDFGTDGEILSFGDAYVLEKRANSNLPKVYYTMDDETLEEVNYQNFVVTQTGAYSIKAINNGYDEEEIVLRGYPYKTSYMSIDYYYPQRSSQFKDNELMISDCTIALNVSSTTLRNRLEFFSKFDTIITLESIRWNYLAGDKVKVIVDERTFEGFIIHKTDTMNGVCSFEILAYEVINNVA